MERETILILDFGSQYTQLIARRFRELSVYSEILPPRTSAESLATRHPKGIVLSGGPDSVHQRGAPRCDPRVFELGVPVVGICYGMQLMSHLLGGEVKRSGQREYGQALFSPRPGGTLFRGVPPRSRVWMSHGDDVRRAPEGFRVVGCTETNPIAALEHPVRRLYGMLFHPEVVHSEEGTKVLENFLEACGCRRDWNARSFVAEATDRVREQVGAKGRVICALSGGVDSAVAALLVQRAVGDRLSCVFVDNGLLRKDEGRQVRRRFAERLRLRVISVDSSRRFLTRLAGVADPERKRKIIGREFIEVFQASMRKVGKAEFLAQGTLYPDVIESVSVKGPSVVIKSHHNVGGLPKGLRFRLVEPLRWLFKDEVRKAGLELDEEFVYRQPFPGPGLAVRCLGPVTRERLDILREADAVFVEEIKAAGLYRKLWQSFAVLLPVRSVGVMGDERTYQYTIALRAVESLDGMTADWVRLPHELLARASSRIVNEVRGVNRVVYDISSKPPSTIEWE
jgi:GMP synthase (glutamine-hydrolysing)